MTVLISAPGGDIIPRDAEGWQSGAVSSVTTADFETGLAQMKRFGKSGSALLATKAVVEHTRICRRNSQCAAARRERL